MGFFFLRLVHPYTVQPLLDKCKWTISEICRQRIYATNLPFEHRTASDSNIRTKICWPSSSSVTVCSWKNRNESKINGNGGGGIILNELDVVITLEWSDEMEWTRHLSTVKKHHSSITRFLSFSSPSLFSFVCLFVWYMIWPHTPSIHKLVNYIHQY